VVLAVRALIAESGLTGATQITGKSRSSLETAAGDRTSRGADILSMSMAVGLGVPRCPVRGYGARSELPGEPTHAEILTWLDAQRSLLESCGLSTDEYRALREGRTIPAERHLMLLDVIAKKPVTP
jgi:hypothetical protein